MPDTIPPNPTSPATPATADTTPDILTLVIETFIIPFEGFSVSGAPRPLCGCVAVRPVVGRLGPRA